MGDGGEGRAAGLTEESEELRAELLFKSENHSD
jgi:hypothetical protein